MATSKFDFSSDSPDRALYNIGQRSPNLAAQLDRSGSLRERMDNSILPSVPHLSRNNSVVAQLDVSSFFQCLRFDPKVVAAEHKSNRPGDLRRFMNVALGFSADESPIGSSKGKVLSSPLPDDIKRVKAGLRESCVKARERVKIFNEALSVFNKFFPSIPLKKRSRSEGFSSDRSNALLSSDRSATGPAFSKMAFQNYTVTGGLDFEQQKSEERPKSSVPNKRTRTSLVDMRMDARNNATVRPSGATDREREMLRVANSGLVLGEDRIVVDGWEKSKMKKKRSMIKPDISSGLSSPKPAEGYRESKQAALPRPVTEARSRSDNEPLGVRPGVANGSLGSGKLDGIQQEGVLGARSSISRTDMETSSLLSDRRERAVCSDKERTNLRPVNKVCARDEFNSASPASSTKATASVRGQRSASSVAPKLSPMIQRATVPGDWELSHCTGRPPTAAGTNNRKRTLAARSSSPPVAHWAGQRPQKISRTARRTNFIPIVPNGDENPLLDNVSDIADDEHGSGFPKRLTSNSPQQVKVKCETLSSAALSESEESGVAEIKLKEKVKQSEETGDKTGPTVQKLSTLVLPPKKSKVTNTENLGDGLRRQGRTGRGSASTRFLMPMAVEKLGNAGTAKQLRSTRHGSDKAETAGRPPTKKLSDRKAYPRQKHTTAIATADLLAGSDDGHEELVAAVNASISSAHAFPSTFWRQMEPFLGFISDADIDFLKQQVNDTSVKLVPTPVPSANIFNTIPNAYGFIDKKNGSGHVSDRISSEFFPEQFPLDAKAAAVPLYQRLIAALISEEDYSVGNEDISLDVYESGFEPEEELGPRCFDQIGNSCNGYKLTGKQERDSEINILLNSGVNSNFSHSPRHVLPDKSLIPGMICSEFQYESLKISEKLLLEAQSIGILLDPMPDVVEMEEDIICEDIVKLDEMYQKQVSAKKGLLDKLLKASLETREIQEREFEQRVLENLVMKAYEKYIACWGRHANGGKSSSSKMLKQAALASAKRTLQRCRKFEETGKSCFSEPIFKDLLVFGFSQSADRAIDASSMGVQTATLTPQLGQTSDFAVNSSDLLQPIIRVSDPAAGEEAAWSSKVYKRELPLDNVGGSGAASGIGSSLSGSTKGKRSEREGKGQGRDVMSRNGTNKVGRPASNVKGERKLKTKPKQKMTQPSVSVNGLMSEQPKPSSTSESKLADVTVNSSGSKGKHEFSLDVLDDPEVDLQLPGQDLGSWLNIDDDGLQDHDFMGLEIPMDDLSDLKMMV